MKDEFLEKVQGIGGQSAFDQNRLNDALNMASEALRERCLKMSLMLTGDDGNRIGATEAIDSAKLFYNFITSSTTK